MNPKIIHHGDLVAKPAKVTVGFVIKETAGHYGHDTFSQFFATTK